MASKARKLIVARLRDEGAKAFADGKNAKFECPYHGDDAQQWRRGWKEMADICSLRDAIKREWL